MELKFRYLDVVALLTVKSHIAMIPDVTERLICNIVVLSSLKAITRFTPLFWWGKGDHRCWGANLVALTEDEFFGVGIGPFA